MAPVLKLDWVSHDAAAYACKNWHYSRALPTGKLVKVGVWEDSQFVGVVIFSRGANRNIGKPYSLQQTEVCELTRVALRGHVTPVSRILAIALKMLRRFAVGVRLVVSYADTAHGHHGGIYQASGWLYTGTTVQPAVWVLGRLQHKKTLNSRYGRNGHSAAWLRAHVDPRAENIAGRKHRYLMPLDASLRAQLAQLVKPYPKRAPQAAESSSMALGREFQSSAAA